MHKQAIKYFRVFFCIFTEKKKSMWESIQNTKIALCTNLNFMCSDDKKIYLWTLYLCFLTDSGVFLCPECIQKKCFETNTKFIKSTKKLNQKLEMVEATNVNQTNLLFLNNLNLNLLEYWKSGVPELYCHPHGHKT